MEDNFERVYIPEFDEHFNYWYDEDAGLHIYTTNDENKIGAVIVDKSKVCALAKFKEAYSYGLMCLNAIHANSAFETMKSWLG